jgi:hypothetical protein
MMRSHAFVAIGILSFLPPSVAAAPPAAALAKAAVAAPGHALSAVNAGDRALIAHRYAPVHHQSVDRVGKNGLGGRADFITRVDFDGDWDARNDWENAARFPLPGAAYHSVVETSTHWFVVYMFFHPRDWGDSVFDTEHENDSEGVLVVISRDGSRFGRLEAAVTVVHGDFYSYVPRRGRWSAGAETVDGVLELDSAAGDRPVTIQEARGHALKAKRRDEPFDGIVYHPSVVALAPPAPGDRTAHYVLVDVFATRGLWDRRDDPGLFSAPGAFAGDRGGTCGERGILCTRDAANAPWGWDDGDDGDIRRGEIATDPVKLVTRYFRTPTPLGPYTWNAYHATTTTLLARR